jgi:hypothetical protein
MFIIRVITTDKIENWEPPMDGAFIVESSPRETIGQSLPPEGWLVFRHNENKLLFELSPEETEFMVKLFDDCNTPPRLEMGLLKGE